MKANIQKIWSELNSIMSLFTIYVHIGEVKAFKPSLPLNHTVRSETLRLIFIYKLEKVVIKSGLSIMK